jgi:hypothetical protein
MQVMVKVLVLLLLNNFLIVTVSKANKYNLTIYVKHFPYLYQTIQLTTYFEIVLRNRELYHQN